LHRWEFTGFTVLGYEWFHINFRPERSLERTLIKEISFSVTKGGKGSRCTRCEHETHTKTIVKVVYFPLPCLPMSYKIHCNAIGMQYEIHESLGGQLKLTHYMINTCQK
jgi:hypothetical protein